MDFFQVIFDPILKICNTVAIQDSETECLQRLNLCSFFLTADSQARKLHPGNHFHICAELMKCTGNSMFNFYKPHFGDTYGMINDDLDEKFVRQQGDPNGK